MRKRRVTQVIYRFSDGTTEACKKVTVINLNFNWVFNALENLRQLVKEKM